MHFSLSKIALVATLLAKDVLAGVYGRHMLHYNAPRAVVVENVWMTETITKYVTVEWNGTSLHTPIPTTGANNTIAQHKAHVSSYTVSPEQGRTKSVRPPPSSAIAPVQSTTFTRATVLSSSAVVKVVSSPAPAIASPASYKVIPSKAPVIPAKLKAKQSPAPTIASSAPEKMIPSKAPVVPAKPKTKQSPAPTIASSAPDKMIPSKAPVVPAKSKTKPSAAPTIASPAPVKMIPSKAPVVPAKSKTKPSPAPAIASPAPVKMIPSKAPVVPAKIKAKPSPVSVKAVSVRKRGAAYNNAALVKSFVGGSSKVSWAYNWGSTTGAIPSGTEYVPMLWGTASVHSQNWNSIASRSIARGSKHLLAFNEPDHWEQANLSPSAAAAGYREFMQPFAGKAKLGAPAVTNGGGSMGLAYLKAFLHACSGCTIDFVPIHWYDSATNVAYFKKHVKEAHAAAGGRPIWITEFAAAGTQAQQTAFLKQVLPWLDSTSYVQRYAYFYADGILTQNNMISALGNTFRSYSG